MSGTSTPSAATTAIPFPRLRPWLVLAVPVLLLVAYLVLMDNGTVSQTGALLHELMHDGRHLLGVPCH
ncbi:unnamed protein product [[Actinomadura] parvosata subsp. kistnae]|uniref:Cobalt transporter n=1 Tax=[Actinomadura] parvosata subsp. kistnae TaxID=1909395 RepID=A0A1U9ZTP3_9ACTN|nr:CbtB-domain containing protein [Nonomuraea sp. ATCC 55076]AQZ61316.1 hypothetical protein BKM31_07310 [Nonomuraea sp. ATCC 55076]SPL97972.1 unnamed protein product [Actinomadura parvosata subsp. kistnae]